MDFERCQYCLHPDGTHHPYCRTQLQGEDLQRYLQGERSGFRAEVVTDSDDPFVHGYLEGVFNREQHKWQKIQDRRFHDLRKELFHERLNATRQPGTVIYRDGLVHHSDMARRIVQPGGAAGDWMLRATFVDGRWRTVAYDDKGIYCISRVDPFYDWEALVVVATNPKKTVLFVEPMSLKEAVLWRP